MNKILYYFIGTCLEIDDSASALSKVGDASHWDLLTEECKPLSKEKFVQLTGDEKVAGKSLEFGIHPQHLFIFGEIPHPDGQGTIHHYYFLERNQEAQVKKILDF